MIKIKNEDNKSNSAFVDISEVLWYAEQYLNGKIGKCSLMQRSDGQLMVNLYGNEDKWLKLHNQLAGLNESKSFKNESVNGYIVVRPQYLASDDQHRYNNVTFNRSDAALFTEYEDAVDAMQMINMRDHIVTDNSKFSIEKFK